MASDNLKLSQLTGSENEKTNLINEIVQQLEDALTEELSIAVAGVTLVLSADQCHRYMVYEFTGTPGANRTIQVLADKKLYICENATTDGYTHTVKTAAGSGVALLPGVKKTLYCDGTNVIEVGSGSQLLQTFGFGNGDTSPLGTGVYLRTAGWVSSSASVGYVMTRVGSVVGVGVTLNVVSQTNPGNILVEAMVEGGATLTATIAVSGTGRYEGTATQGVGIDTVAVEDILAVRVTFSGGFAGTFDDPVAHVEIATSL